jgi:hypothetical protein
MDANYYMINLMNNYYIYCLTYSRQVFKLPENEKYLLVNDESSRMKVRGEVQSYKIWQGITSTPIKKFILCKNQRSILYYTLANCAPVKLELSYKVTKTQNQKDCTLLNCSIFKKYCFGFPLLTFFLEILN